LRQDFSKMGFDVLLVGDSCLGGGGRELRGIAEFEIRQRRGGPTCGNSTKLPPAAAKAGVTYEKDIKPIFEKSCLKCHSGEKPQGQVQHGIARQKSSRAAAEGPSVAPGNSAKSALVHLPLTWSRTRRCLRPTSARSIRR